MLDMTVVSAITNRARTNGTPFGLRIFIRRKDPLFTKYGTLLKKLTGGERCSCLVGQGIQGRRAAFLFLFNLREFSSEESSAFMESQGYSLAPEQGRVHRPSNYGLEIYLPKGITYQIPDKLRLKGLAWLEEGRFILCLEE